MADSNWLTPRQVNALGHKEQQEYIRQRLNEMREETSDDEQLSDMDVGGVNADDSDSEEVQLPEFDPETDRESCENWLSEFFDNGEASFYKRDIMKLTFRWKLVIDQNGAYLT